MTRREVRILLAAVAWTVYVWVSRIALIVRDHDHGVGFKAVHTVLAVVSLGFAVAIARIALRARTRV